jgi:hypothetical protein
MTNKRKKRKPVIPALIVVAIIVIVGVIAGYLWHKNVHKSSTVTSSNRSIYSPPEANANVPGGKPSSSQGSSISSSKGSSSSQTPMVSSTVQPNTPIGEFVSDHSPNLSGTPHPNSESSTCTTTAGVNCQISFTSGSTVKSLSNQTTDTNGNTSWNWTLQSVGLTAGTWQVTATATNGSKTASTNDVTKLVVSP